MRAPFPRAAKVPADVLGRAGLPRGARVLAHTQAADGSWLLGTRDALVLVPGDEAGRRASGCRGSRSRRPTGTATRSGSGSRRSASSGAPRTVHEVRIADPGRLLQLVRERVTASVLLQRRIVLPGSRKGLMVVARRSPHRDGEISWAVEYDVGVDPADPAVADGRGGGSARRARVGRPDLAAARPSLLTSVAHDPL